MGDYLANIQKILILHYFNSCMLQGDRRLAARQVSWSGGRVVRQRSAKPLTPVRVRSRPQYDPVRKAARCTLSFFISACIDSCYFLIGHRGINFAVPGKLMTDNIKLFTDEKTLI